PERNRRGGFLLCTSPASATNASGNTTAPGRTTRKWPTPVPRCRRRIRWPQDWTMLPAWLHGVSNSSPGWRSSTSRPRSYSMPSPLPPMTPQNPLQNHRKLCDELYQLALEENRFLKEQGRLPSAELVERKQQLLVRLDESLAALRATPRDQPIPAD